MFHTDLHHQVNKPRPHGGQVPCSECKRKRVPKDRGRIPRDLQGTWDWTVRHGDVSTGGRNPYLKEALQTMFETGLPAIVYEELTGEEYHPVDGARHIR